MNENPKQFLIDNFAYRMGEVYPGGNVQIGTGNPMGSIVVVQPSRKFAERDAVTGALKRFGMLDEAFRTTSKMIEYSVEWDKSRENRAYLLELIQIIRPMLVIACGPDVLSCLAGEELSFDRYTGKRIKLEELAGVHVYVTLNPMDYGFARAPEDLKQQGRLEWESISEFYHQERKRQESLRWTA